MGRDAGLRVVRRLGLALALVLLGGASALTGLGVWMLAHASGTPVPSATVATCLHAAQPALVRDGDGATLLVIASQPVCLWPPLTTLQPMSP